MSLKPIVRLTEKDKKELGYLSDSAFYETFRVICGLMSVYSLPIENINLSKLRCSQYYLVLTPLFERETFTYISAKDAGFNIGINCIERLTVSRGAVPKARITAGGSAVLTHDSKTFSFTFGGAKKKGLISPIALEEEDYLSTWFLITKDNYQLCCNLI